jgi:hypothetical protein
LHCDQKFRSILIHQYSPFILERDFNQKLTSRTAFSSRAASFCVLPGTGSSPSPGQFLRLDAVHEARLFGFTVQEKVRFCTLGKS